MSDRTKNNATRSKLRGLLPRDQFYTAKIKSNYKNCYPLKTYKSKCFREEEKGTKNLYNDPGRGQVKKIIAREISRRKGFSASTLAGSNSRRVRQRP